MNVWKIKSNVFTLYLKVLFYMNNNSIDQLSEIKNLMERSSRFLSLSGLSGISAGIVALLGSIFAFFYLEYDLRYFDPVTFFLEGKGIHYESLIPLCADALIMLVLAIGIAFFFTARKAKKQGLLLWSNVSRLMLINLAIPLVTGGLFCIILLYYGIIFLIAPATLIFYGLALINAGKYTLSEIRWLGASEVILGLIASVFYGYGLLVWAIGFGILHVVYGSVMYFRYERNS